MPTTVVLVDHDPGWAGDYRTVAGLISSALGPRALVIEHAGSTSVPGLAAKPIIDVVLLVADSADEASYLPSLEAAGFALRHREPAWFEHRLLALGGPPVNLHVFSLGCEEAQRMIDFRDHLRANADDRLLYERTKRALASRPWETVQDYANAKTDVIRQILRRACEPS